jgi:hypothetical protein
MTQVIIYKQDSGVVTILVPTPEALAKHSIEAIAIKDVPAGKPFKIVDAADIPTDRTFREAWTMPEEELSDGVGNETNEFPEESPQ